MPRLLGWSSVALLAAALLLLWMDPPQARRSPPPGPAAPRAVPAPQCAAGTLEDQGVCLPVPAPSERVDAPEPGDFIPRLPGRPSELDGYVLPAPGVGRLLPLEPKAVRPGPMPSHELLLDLEGRAAGAPSGPESVAGQSLLMLADPGSPLHTDAFEQLGTAQIVAFNREQHWLLLGFSPPGESTSGVLLLLSGVNTDQSTTAHGPLADSASIRSLGERWLLAARQMRPNESFACDSACWSDERSIPTDIRNVLRERSAAPHNTNL